jgi:hypothetical protein
MTSRYATKKGRTAKRGLFVGGIWHCDCEPRMPADKFQTKNGGKNHGRWFYTCQKPQPKRCSFFLWQDDAKIREEGAVLSNSRTEPPSVEPLEPQTPKRIGKAGPVVQSKITAQIPTPSTKSRSPVKLEAIPPPQKDVDDYNWSDDDEDLASALEEFETPRKVARTETITSPTKHRSNGNGSARSTTSHASSTTLPLEDPDRDDVFRTPATHRIALPTTPTSPLAHKIHDSVNHSLTPRPTSPTSTSKPTPSTPLASLETQLLPLLPPLPVNAFTHLKTLLSQDEARTAGIIKSRDLARATIETQKRQIAELQQRIRGLELERETMRSVVAHLKADMKESPPKRGRGGRGRGTKSDV